MVDHTLTVGLGLQAGTGTNAASGTASAGATTNAEDRAKIVELAREFESYFILQMLRQMRQSMLEEENGTGLGAGTMTDTLDIELGRQLANGGGIGLASVLQTALERQVGAGGSQAASASVAGAAMPLSATPALSTVGTGPIAAAVSSAASGRVLAGTARLQVAAYLAASDETALPLPVSAPVSSHYGWRSDPFTGSSRFHSGVDIAAAYGREVPAAEAGQVVYAGTQGGYGNTVVIAHEGGVQTRYAHLSSIQVVPGEEVDAGSVIGRVGSTRRSTGPHLHFEVLQDGHPVNPEAAATRFAAQLKTGGGNADLPLDQSSVHEVAAGVDDED